MEEEKGSFIFYKSFFDALQDLKDKDRLQVYDAICQMALNRKESKLTGISKTIFTLIKPQIVANNLRYKNGKKGGRPKKETTGLEEKETIGFSKKEIDGSPNTKTETKPNENVNVNENENVNENAVVNELGFKNIISCYENNIAPATAFSVEILKDYYDELGEELVIEGIKRAVLANKRNARYLKGILDSWAKKGFKTLIDVQNETQEFNNRKETQMEGETEEESNARKLQKLKEALGSDIG